MTNRELTAEDIFSAAAKHLDTGLAVADTMQLPADLTPEQVAAFRTDARLVVVEATQLMHQSATQIEKP